LIPRSRAVVVTGLAGACGRSWGISRRGAGAAWVSANEGFEQR